MFALSFREPVSEDSALTSAEQDYRAVAARLAAARPRDPLLNDAAAQIGIHLVPVGACFGVH
jgi:hypothetical protein